MTDRFDIPGLPNERHPAPDYISGGQPTEAQLEATAKAGLGRIINLRPTSEDAGFDEAAKAAELGIAYLTLGIAGPADLTRGNVRKFDAMLGERPQVPTLVHCGSGNRVGALSALRAGWLEGKSQADALATGRRWGLTKLEAPVGQLLASR